MTPALAVVPPISKAIAFLSPMRSHKRLGPDDPRRRSGFEHPDAGALRLLDAEQAAGRLHDQKVAAKAGGREMIADLAEIASHAWPDIGIRRRRRGAFELAIFLRELVRGGDEEMRMARLDNRFHALLVRGIAVGVQEQDRDRLHALAD